MTATLATQAPNFHGLTGTQAVGRRQIATQSDYAGSVTVLYRANDSYWVVVTRDVQNAFTDGSEVGSSVAIWFDQAERRYVADYYSHDGVNVEAGRAHSLGAAIGIAASVSSHRWAQSR